MSNLSCDRTAADVRVRVTGPSGRRVGGGDVIPPQLNTTRNVRCFLFLSPSNSSAVSTLENRPEKGSLLLLPHLLIRFFPLPPLFLPIF